MGSKPVSGSPADLTRTQAIQLLVEQDVKRWGETEREASQRLHAGRSLGLALTELANRAELSGEPSRALRAAAESALTDGDLRALDEGG